MSRDVLGEAIEKLSLADLWDLAPMAGAAPQRDGVVKSPFREDRTPSFSLTKNLSYFVDFGNREIKGGVWNFVKFARPEMSKGEIARLLIERAGLEDTRGKSFSARDRQALRAEKQAQANDARERVYRERRRAKAIVNGTAAPVVVSAPAFVLERYDEGVKFLRGNPGRIERIALERGWPVGWVEECAHLGLLSTPLEPGFDGGEKGARRGIAFAVHWPKPLEGWSLLTETGYHQRVFVPPRAGKPERRIWNFCPHRSRAPEKYRSEYQARMIALAQERRIGEGEAMIAPAPFLLGNPADMRLLIVTEGQWDAISVWGAMGGFDEHFDLPICVAGIRGASGDGVFFDALGPWLRRANPVVWVLADRDAAGKRWYAPAAEPGKLPPVSFVERLKGCAAAVKLSLLREGDVGKDFNDYWKAARPSAEKMLRWMDKIGVLPK